MPLIGPLDYTDIVHLSNQSSIPAILRNFSNSAETPKFAGQEDDTNFADYSAGEFARGRSASAAVTGWGAFG
jgi:hypothetical protein